MKRKIILPGYTYDETEKDELPDDYKGLLELKSYGQPDLPTRIPSDTPRKRRTP